MQVETFSRFQKVELPGARQVSIYCQCKYPVLSNTHLFTCLLALNCILFNFLISPHFYPVSLHFSYLIFLV